MAAKPIRVGAMFACLPVLLLATGCGDSESGVECSALYNACTLAGQLRCDRTRAVQTCQKDQDGCLVWIDTTSCAGRQACENTASGPVCVCQDDCPAGSTRCDVNRLQTCLSDADGCLSWSPGIDCAVSGMVCAVIGDAATCVIDCADCCDTEHQRRCNQTIIEVCQRSGDGSLRWSLVVDCDDGQQDCDDSGGSPACIDRCENQCPSSGETRCQDTVLESCAPDADGCSRWITVADCADSSKRCDESTGPAACVCLGDCPAVGATRCQDDAVQVCAADAERCLSWQLQTDCAASGMLCDQGVDGAACVCAGECGQVGDSRCADTAIENCHLQANGCLGWELESDCADQDLDCDDTGGAAVCVCTDSCPAAGDNRCTGKLIQTCGTGPDGCLVWSDGTDCAAAGQDCDDAVGPAACVPYLACGESDLGSTTGQVAAGISSGSADDFQGSCAGAVGGEDLCFDWTAPDTSSYRIDTIGSDYDTVLMVYSAGVELACGDDTGDTTQSAVSVDLEQDQPVIIVVDTYAGASGGNFILNITPFGPENLCDDLEDNDFDGLIDCADPSDCQQLADCIPGMGPVGSSCAVASECAAPGSAPACLTEALGWPGGSCSQWCNRAADDCPVGAVCSDLEGRGLCLDTCDRDTDPCRAGYRCCYDTFAGTYVCIPSEWPCPSNCGDSDVDGIEQCDLENLDGADCPSLGFSGGDLACTDTCLYDFSGCTGRQPCESVSGLGPVASGNNLLRGDGYQGSCAPEAGGRDVCFDWTSPSNGCFHFTALAGGYPAVLLLLDDQGTEMACNPVAGVSVQLTINQDVTAVVDAIDEAGMGDYALDISNCCPESPPSRTEFNDTGNNQVLWNWNSFTAGPGTAEDTYRLLWPGSRLTIAGTGEDNGDDGPGSDYLDVDSFRFNSGTAADIYVMLDVAGTGADLDVVITDTEFNYVAGRGLVGPGSAGTLDGLMEEGFWADENGRLFPGSEYYISVGTHQSSAALPVNWQLTLCAE